MNSPGFINFRIECPQQLACFSVLCIHHTPGAGGIHHAIYDDRCAFQTTVAACLELPGKAELLHILFIDLCERTETFFIVRATIGEPVTLLLIGMYQTFSSTCALIRRSSGVMEITADEDTSKHSAATARRVVVVSFERMGISSCSRKHL
jgi:hypothetical protein